MQCNLHKVCIHDLLTSVDTNVTVGIEISGMENLESVRSVEIIPESGLDVNIYTVREQGAGRRHNFYRQEISVPRQVLVHIYTDSEH